MAKMMKKAGAGDSYTDYAKKSGKPDSVTDYAGKAGKPDSYTQYKKGGVVKKAKSGFGMLSVKAGVDKNPKATFADKIAGAKGMAKSGKMVKAAKQAATAIAMKKAGKAPKKMMKNGGILSAPKKDGLSMQLGTYKNVIGKNYTGKNVVNKGAKAKMGKSMGKCKSGC
jgi:hypothetical protein